MCCILFLVSRIMVDEWFWSVMYSMLSHMSMFITCKKE